MNRIRDVLVEQHVRSLPVPGENKESYPRYTVLNTMYLSMSFREVVSLVVLKLMRRIVTISHALLNVNTNGVVGVNARSHVARASNTTKRRCVVVILCGEMPLFAPLPLLPCIMPASFELPVCLTCLPLFPRSSLLSSIGRVVLSVFRSPPTLRTEVKSALIVSNGHAQIMNALLTAK